MVLTSENMVHIPGTMDQYPTES